jgi:uncharacterized coiled-coil protein SlyX
MAVEATSTDGGGVAGQSGNGTPVSGESSHGAGGAVTAGDLELLRAAQDAKLEGLSDTVMQMAEKQQALIEALTGQVRDTGRATSAPTAAPGPEAIEKQIQELAEQLDASPGLLRYLNSLMTKLSGEVKENFDTLRGELRSQDELESFKKEATEKMERLVGADVLHFFESRHPETREGEGKRAYELALKTVQQTNGAISLEEAYDKSRKYLIAERERKLFGGDETTEEEKQMLRNKTAAQVEEYLATKRAVSEGQPERDPKEYYDKGYKHWHKGLREAARRDAARAALEVLKS